VPGSALARIVCRHEKIMEGHPSRDPTELKDLSQTVRNFNKGVARLWPSADLRERAAQESAGARCRRD